MNREGKRKMREAEGMGAQCAGTMEEDGYWRILDGLAATSTIVIDGPKGTSHPRYPDSIYPVDYGYLRDTASMDGSGIDVWVGTGLCGIDAIICVADLVKRGFRDQDSDRLHQGREAAHLRRAQ
ncbi:hypothetical protein BAAA27672_04440 [Bifidobacterium animalis subsp. animalis ATCC 27672]|nr:hypothetical protein BAAA27672_04440 [Bifidobacterium animalis subsp. animalis ATCC 27672]